jgi:hypothetical protein
MKRLMYALAVLSLIAISPSFHTGGGAPAHGLIATASAAPSPACTFPNRMAATPEQTAWQLFVAATCPTNKNQVVWENWIEQLNMYPASGKSGAKQAVPHKRLHGSPLTHAVAANLAQARGEKLPALAPDSQCNIMNGPPKNVIPNATICEEAHLNPEARAFVASNGYQIRPGQTKAAQKGADIQFPWPAIEVKADWIPATDFTPPFTCAAPPSGVHVETIDGACYALAGIHISSKLLPNWVWATFEPQSNITNINRCVVLGCNDPWGSIPATRNGANTNQTPALKALMTQARLAPEWFNYRLDGVQTEFGTASNPTLLGNSVIEGYNVGMNLKQASCITCHSVSTIKNTGGDGIVTLAGMPIPPVGPEFNPATGWIARDFVWSLGLACPQVPGGGGLQTCSSSSEMKKEEMKKEEKNR